MPKTRFVLRVDLLPTETVDGAFMPRYPDEQVIASKGFLSEDRSFRALGTIYLADNVRTIDQPVCPASEYLTLIVLDGHKPKLCDLWQTAETPEHKFITQALDQLFYWAITWVKRMQEK